MQSRHVRSDPAFLHAFVPGCWSYSQTRCSACAPQLINMLVLCCVVLRCVAWRRVNPRGRLGNTHLEGITGKFTRLRSRSRRYIYFPAKPKNVTVAAPRLGCSLVPSKPLRLPSSGSVCANTPWAPPCRPDMKRFFHKPADLAESVARCQTFARLYLEQPCTVPSHPK